MSMPDVGAAAPAFSLPDQDGNTVSLADFAGKWVVLYFYPKDDTPGCTKEACSFRDRHAELQAKGAVVLGVSGDSSASHRKFADKYSLPFPLLADTEHEVARAYGAWGTKKMYGKEYEGMIRSTVVIDPAGKVVKTWPKVKPDGHGDEVLAWLEANAK
ncbi:thioredoxin-dependent thiol peroxidase [Tepidiforma sp.]|uniref:thioredoxin-dependent thiol peroxidase n=1 Tax=Tepidiforma sp. TaxID=2682230 RepID=UPI00261A3323|nr:thioredoxin-dependent thiol peroxidase [Tepidiforma sp.]MCX7617558.1 thioredoxin-dependent thiol peroxidase [Tepidiforma sp.]